MTEITLPVFKLELWSKQRRDGPKKYDTKKSDYSRITGEQKRLEYLGFRVEEFNAMCKQIVSRY